MTESSDDDNDVGFGQLRSGTFKKSQNFFHNQNFIQNHFVF